MRKICLKNPCQYLCLGLMVTQIFVGLLLIVFAHCNLRKVNRYFPDAQLNELTWHYYLMDIYSIHLILTYICGLPLIPKMLNDPYTHHLAFLLKMWIFFAAFVSIDGVLYEIILFKRTECIKESIRLALTQGIDVYYSDSQWRLIWDELQYDEGCCGVMKYTDWQDVTFDEVVTVERSDIIDDTNVLSLLPYSCCRKYTGGCYEKYMLTYFLDEIMSRPKLNTSVINQHGCLSVFENQIRLTKGFSGVFVALVIIIQIFLIFVMRSVFMSNRNYAALDTSDMQSQTDISTGMPISAEFTTSDEHLPKSYGNTDSSEPNRSLKDNRITWKKLYRKASGGGDGDNEELRTLFIN